MSDTSNQTTISAGCKRLEIDVQPAFMAEQVVGLLNHRDAVIAGDQILASTQGGCYGGDGTYVIAKVLHDNGENPHGNWRLGEPDGDCADCSGRGSAPELSDADLAALLRARASRAIADRQLPVADSLLAAVNALVGQN